MGDFTVLKELLPFLVPLLIVELVLIVVALRDLVKRKTVLGGNKVVWALVIVFIQIIGAVLYFTIGRKESPVDGD